MSLNKYKRPRLLDKQEAKQYEPKKEKIIKKVIKKKK